MPDFRIRNRFVFPDPRLAGAEGLVAAGGDLQPERLLSAYSQGIFPWFSEGDPIMWFSPDPRMVLYPDDFRLSESLRRVIASQRFESRIDTDFETVIAACAETPRPGQDGTWITRDMQQAYIALHQIGYAHSFETYHGGKLVGGLYGISLGSAFFGESMFHHETDASKVAFARMVSYVRKYSFSLIDAQQPTDHLRRLGAQEVPRDRFLEELAEALEKPTRQGSWSDIASMTRH